MNKKTLLPEKKLYLFLFVFSLVLSAFLILYKLNEVPPGFNADEAAFGYNAYSIAQTGADEYGNKFPPRLKSFGDYKLPLYSYFSIPFITIFGLNEFSVRFLNIILALSFPFILYLLTKELFEKKEIALISTMLLSVSLGKGIVARHAHEALLAGFLITLASYFFIKYLKMQNMKDGIFFSLMMFLGLFSYQSSRLFAVYFFVFSIIFFILKKNIRQNANKLFILLFSVVIGIFVWTDIVYTPVRVQNLFLTSTPGFSLRIREFTNEGANRFAYNKLTIGIKDVVYKHFEHFSPQFLAINGDTNFRFGYPQMAPMTIIEYLFIFIGIYYLFKNKERWRFFIVGLLFITPLTASVTWTSISLTRTFFILIPALIISSYGMYHFIISFTNKRLTTIMILLIVIVESYFLFYSWDFYFNHYPKRDIVVRSWQSGYRELSTYLTNNYELFNTFYITPKNGQPYIFTLFYTRFSPESYHKQAVLSSPDEFGFGQVEKYDKYIFSIPDKAFSEEKVSIIGYPDDFNGRSSSITSKVKKIIINGEEIFWIYEKK